MFIGEISGALDVHEMMLHVSSVRTRSAILGFLMVFCPQFRGYH